jgi:hypothetical protein
LLGDVERPVRRVAWGEPPRRQRGTAGQQVGLVGQADADQPAARALRAVHQRWRCHVGVRGVPQFLDELQGAAHQSLVEGYDDPPAVLGEVEDAVLALVAGFS